MKTNSEIEQLANSVIAKYVKRGGSHKCLLDIISDNGIKYREVNSTNNAFVGAFTKGINSQPYIMVNSSIDNQGRKNFTIAHELGHYLLNHHLTQSSFYCNNDEISEGSIWSDPIEQEANYFATCLLMPAEKVKGAFLGMLQRSRKAKIKDYLHVKNDYTYSIWRGIGDDLMKRYGVSEAALRYRLERLNIAKFEF